MSEPLARLSDADLRTLALALRSGRVPHSVSTLALQRLIPAPFAEDAGRGIQALVSQGMDHRQVAAVLELIVRDRAARGLPDGAVDVVTTGPDAVGANRDTGVVVRELFAQAETSVLVAGYAVYQGQAVFAALADRMRRIPALQVKMFLDIQRTAGDTATDAELVRRFTDRFRRWQWPSDYPLPSLYYDPRSLDLTQDKRACLHAKCVVVDLKKVFVSSANFTEAAQLRNIEVGVLIDAPATASQVTAFFNGLVSDGRLVPVR